MIRLICKELAMDYDGKTHSSIKTFDVEFPEVEKYLSEKVGYADSGSRHIIGEEIIDHLPQEKEPSVKDDEYAFPKPTKEVPDTAEILKIIDKIVEFNTTLKSLDFASFRHQLAQEISALYRKEGGL